MPRLVKGGKYVYGWSEVSVDGRVVVPVEALEEYNLKNTSKVILLSGSKRSGGFALTNLNILNSSRLSTILDSTPLLTRFQVPEGKTIKITGNPWCWVTLSTDGSFVVPLTTLKEYGVNPGNLLLSVRGSRFGLGFCVKGPLIDEAKKHSCLKLFR